LIRLRQYVNAGSAGCTGAYAEGSVRRGDSLGSGLPYSDTFIPHAHLPRHSKGRWLSWLHS
jgi:hypothetical protein